MEKFQLISGDVPYMNWNYWDNFWDDCFWRPSSNRNYPDNRASEGSVIWKPAATTAVEYTINWFGPYTTVPHAIIAPLTRWRSSLYTQSFARCRCIMRCYEQYRFNEECLLVIVYNYYVQGHGISRAIDFVGGPWNQLCEHFQLLPTASINCLDNYI